MTYAAQRDALIRTRQDLLVIGVRECQNRYAELVQQLMTYTEQLDNAAYVKTGVTLAGTDAVEAPDGTLTAETFTFTASLDRFNQTVTGYAVTSKAFTGSVWAKLVSGGPSALILRIANVAGTEFGTAGFTADGTWQRFWVHKLFTATPTDDVVLEVRKFGTAGLPVTVALWGMNLTRNPTDQDQQVQFPYRKREAETVSTVSVNASRCNIADAGDGARCYYSRPTCQDPDNFNAGNSYEATTALQGIREFRFCRHQAPLPLATEQVHPLLTNVASAAQEIDSERAVTIKERVTFEFEDDTNPGLWNPVQSGLGALVNTATGTGTFWRRWAVIYKNYSNPACYAIRKAGFVETGGTEADYQTRGKFLMQNIEFIDERVRLTCGDRLKLTRRTIPSVLGDDNTLQATIGAADTTLVLKDAGEVSPVADNADGSAPDYKVVILIDSEKMNVQSIDLDTNTLTVQRGRWGTVAAVHGSGAAVSEVAEFGTERDDPAAVPLGKNGIDIIIELVRYAGLADDEIDTTTLESERDTWLPSAVDTATGAISGTVFRRTLTETTEVETLITELRELTFLFLWISEAQQLTGRVFAPVVPDAGLTTVTDDANIVAGSVTVDDNDETRLSRVLIAWDLLTDQAGSKPSDFDDVRIEIDVDAEEPEYYGEPKLRAILTQWLAGDELATGASLTAAYLTGHLLARFRHGARRFVCKLDIKDDDIGLGDYIIVSSRYIQDEHGNNRVSAIIVTKKKPIDDSVFSIEGLDTGLFHRYAFYTDTGFADYTAATDSEKERGYYSNTTGFLGSPLVRGYYYW